jgi:predicted acetylornithine/succinylornithine family transaminase
MTTEELIEAGNKYLFGTYKRFPIVLVRGRGARVWDSDGREYLDFLAGIAVCNLGHSHPRVVGAIQAQAEKLTHVSNLYHIEPQIRLAKLLVEHSFADRVFFGNSGAEAIEGAIKLARKYGHERMGGDRYEIIAMDNSFHGRTLAAVTATGQKKYQAGFDPLPAGFRHVPFNDLEAAKAAVSGKTCGILVEPVQGEGGIRIPSPGYLKGLRKLCDDRGLLLIFDEVQTGMGRTGHLFGHEEWDVKPDIMTLAKALGNGYPLGALLAREAVASVFVPGTHASTFGGNPLGMAAGIAVLETLLDGNTLPRCRAMGTRLRSALESLKGRHGIIREVRGLGLMTGVELSVPGDEIVVRAMKKGLLINCTAGNVLRLVPPLVITEEDVDGAVRILDEVLGES